MNVNMRDERLCHLTSQYSFTKGDNDKYKL